METPTAMPTLTPTPAPYVYMVLDSGQAATFVYSADAADVVIVFLLAGLLFSVWLFGLMWYRRR